MPPGSRASGRLEWILNTPSAHRVHHASNLEYLDGNYGGVLIVFDRLFGTYIAERADLPCRYGLVEPITSYNLLRIEFHQWRALWRDLRAARSLRAVSATSSSRPAGARRRRQTTEELRAARGVVRRGAAAGAAPIATPTTALALTPVPARTGAWTCGAGAGAHPDHCALIAHHTGLAIGAGVAAIHLVSEAAAAGRCCSSYRRAPD